MSPADQLARDAEILINRLQYEELETLGTYKAIARLKDSISLYNRSK